MGNTALIICYLPWQVSASQLLEIQNESDLISCIAHLMDEEEDAMLATALTESKMENTNLLKQEAAVDDALARRGLTRVRVQGDGNCQYASVLVMLGKEPTSQAIDDLRNQVVGFMVEHKDRFSGSFELRDGETIDTVWARFLDTVLTDKTWGDNLTLVVMAELLQCEFLLVESDRETLISAPSATAGLLPCFMLAFQRELHYDATAPLEAGALLYGNFRSGCAGVSGNCMHVSVCAVVCGCVCERLRAWCLYASLCVCVHPWD